MESKKKYTKELIGSTERDSTDLENKLMVTKGTGGRGKDGLGGLGLAYSH